MHEADPRFRPLGIAVLTVSDSRGPDQDPSGDLLAELLIQAGHRLAQRAWVRDEVAEIQEVVRAWIADPEVQVVLATGGTGVAARDRTPEALAGLWEREIPGFGEAFRRLSEAKIGSAALLSRACAGLAAGTYLFALPGSTGGCRDAWEGLLAAQLDTRTRPCSLAAMLPHLGGNGELV